MSLINRLCRRVLALSLLISCSAWADSYIYKGASHTYNSGATISGDTTLALNSSGFGGVESFAAVLRQGSNSGTAVILLHGRGEAYIDGHVILPLRLALNDMGFTTLSIDTPAAKPAPSSDFVYADYQADANPGGTNYVFPEMYGRIRAAASKLQTLGATQVILVGFSLGSRFTTAYLRYGSPGVLPITRYIGIGMGIDTVTLLDTATSIRGVAVPALELYGSADNAEVLAGVSSRRTNYAGPSYTQIVQSGATHQWVGYENQLIGYVQSWLQEPNYSDSWWNANESGWGITITDHGSNAFIQWYTYDQTGHNQKYVISGGTFSGDKCTFNGAIQRVTGPSWTLPTFDPSLVARTTTGSATIDFCPAGLPAGTAVFHYTTDGVTGSKQLTRLAFGNDEPRPGEIANTGATDFTDLWWNPNEAGWGVSVTQHGNNIFFRIFVYDTDGRPLLFVVPGVTFNSPTSFTGAVQLTSGPYFGTEPFDPAAVVRTTAGSATLTFSGANDGVLTYTVNGITKTKSIVRLSF